MTETLQFLLRHGYAAVFACVLIEQLGLPFPAAPILVAAGALAGSGRLGFAQVIGLVLAASLAADVLWYVMGWRRGGRVLSFLCRLSLEPDSCARRTQDTFARRGAWALLVSKFIPGLSTVAPPLAGMIRMRLWRFLLLDSAGIIVWSLVFCGVGYFFTRDLEGVAQRFYRMGDWIPISVIGGLAAYVGWKYLQRRRFLRGLDVARITPDELKEKLDAGEPVVIVDLRHTIEIEGRSETIPGALQLTGGELDHRHEEIPRDRDVVLYCS